MSDWRSHFPVSEWRDGQPMKRTTCERCGAENHTDIPVKVRADGQRLCGECVEDTK